MFSLLGTAFTLAALTAPKSNLVISPCHAGEHYQYTTVGCSFELRNTGDTAISVSQGSAKTPGDSIDLDRIVVRPRSSSYINVKVALGSSIGATQRTFVFRSDEPGMEQRGSTVFAYVTSILDDATPTLSFGDVKFTSGSLAKTIELTSREVPDFRIEELVSIPDYVDVLIGPDSRSLRATFKENAPWGRHADGILVRTNADKQKLVRVQVDVNVLGAVLPDSNPYSLGLMRTNERNEFLIRLTSPTSTNFQVGDITLSGLQGEAELTQCQPATAGCRLVKLVVKPAQATGRIEGVMSVSLPEYKQTLPIQLIGMLLKPETEIHDMNRELEAAQKGGESKLPADSGSGGIDLSKEIRREVSNTDIADPPGAGPLLKWSVANEGSIYGYVVYRSDTERGQYVRVNEATIVAPPYAEGVVNTYKWRDSSAQTGKTYWYSVGTLKKNGEKVDLVQPQKVVAK